jgi:hypothetical protein
MLIQSAIVHRRSDSIIYVRCVGKRLAISSEKKVCSTLVYNLIFTRLLRLPQTKLIIQKREQH